MADESSAGERAQSLVASSRLAQAADPCARCEARLVSICQGVGGAFLDRLSAIVTSVTVEPHAILIDEGEPAAHAFNITAGMAKLFKILPDGRQQIIGFLLTGDFIGFGPGERHGYTVEAITPLGACRFPRVKLEALLSEFPDMEHRLRRLLLDELDRTQDQMLLLGRKSARERLASFVLQCERRRARLGLPSDPIELPMTRGDIADYLGLTTETVSRTFTQFREEGLVSLVVPTELSIADRPALVRLAEGWR